MGRIRVVRFLRVELWVRLRERWKGGGREVEEEEEVGGRVVLFS